MDRIYEIIERDGFGGLTEDEAGLFAIHWFFLETQNGGIHQFFFNDSGGLADPALRHLERIGAPKTAAILARAIGLFPGGRVPTDLGGRRNLLIDHEDDYILLEPLTDEFFTCDEDVAAIHDAYALAHPDRFERVREPAA